MLQIGGIKFYDRGKLNSDDDSGVQKVQNRNNSGIPRSSEWISQPSCTCISKFVDDKSIMPFHWHSPHHLMVYHNLTSYQTMTMMKSMKYSGTHLCMCIKMNSLINLFVSVNQ